MKSLVTILVLTALSVGMVSAQTKKENPMVVLETTKGNIEIELYLDKAPITVQNFLWYVDNKFYDGLIFHRVIPGFMIQGGGFTPDMVQKSPKPAIDNEAANGLKNEKYTLAMARTQAVHSASSQFFINVADNAFLDHRDTTPQGFGYCVFGKVTFGQSTVDALAKVPTGTKGGHNDVPTEPVIIKKAYRKAAAAKEPAAGEKKG